MRVECSWPWSGRARGLKHKGKIPARGRGRQDRCWLHETGPQSPEQDPPGQGMGQAWGPSPCFGSTGTPTPSSTLTAPRAVLVTGGISCVSLEMLPPGSNSHHPFLTLSVPPAGTIALGKPLSPFSQQLFGSSSCSLQTKGDPVPLTRYLGVPQDPETQILLWERRRRVDGPQPRGTRCSSAWCCGHWLSSAGDWSQRATTMAQLSLVLPNCSLCRAAGE